MRTKYETRGTRGQILIAVAAAMMVLLAIGAIVVDLGFSWMLHRHQQNVADPASLAAARWIPDFRATNDPRFGPLGPDDLTPPGLMWQEACAVARQNGLFAGASGNTECVPANDGERAASLVVNYPPTGNAGAYLGRQGFVQVVIEGSHPSFFGLLF